MKTSTLISLLLMCVVSGCVTRIESVQQPKPEAPPPLVPAAVKSGNGKTANDRRVMIAPSLQKVLRLVKITSSVSPDGYLKIQMNIQNMTDSFKQFSYRIDWLDDNGQPLTLADVVPLEWTLMRQETSFLAATAPTPAARDFRITIEPK